MLNVFVNIRILIANVLLLWVAQFNMTLWFITMEIYLGRYNQSETHTMPGSWLDSSVFIICLICQQHIVKKLHYASSPASTLKSNPDHLMMLFMVLCEEIF